MTLPITAILPTRNAMGAIDAHLHEIAGWLADVAQVVVVDSSEDGTLDYLRTKIDLPNAEFHSRPRGLYESWNFGVRQAKSEFVYFSTVGDTISGDGLRHLYDVAKRQEADIVISPPEMRSETGDSIPANWPIHDFCAQFDSENEHTLASHEAFLLSISYVPSTILGSSASNLYRREFLTQNPFLENWGHCADSPWMIANSLRARVAVTTRTVAKFVVHAKEPATGAHVVGITHYEDMYERARASLRTSDRSDLEKKVLSGWLEGLVRRNRLFFERIESHVGYLARRDARIKALDERVVTARARSAQLEGQLKESNQKVIDLRRKLWDYERRHRSLLSIIGIYLAVKAGQLRTIWTLALRQIRKSL